MTKVRQERKSEKCSGLGTHGVRGVAAPHSPGLNLVGHFISVRKRRCVCKCMPWRGTRMAALGS